MYKRWGNSAFFDAVIVFFKILLKQFIIFYVTDKQEKE